jgi:hypothetical protein
LWAREHLPVGCIDYFSRRWLTSYWLHLDLLGNPKHSVRMLNETFEFRDTGGNGWRAAACRMRLSKTSVDSARSAAVDEYSVSER